MPTIMQDDVLKQYYDILKRKFFYRFFKRLFDIFASLILLIVLMLPSIIIGLSVVFTSKGGPFFCQKRVGRYGKAFYIIKFRTMIKNSEGSRHITHNNDSRITSIGKILRKTHIDEFPQLLNVFVGHMSFVGTRPEVVQFVDQYKKEWLATLLQRPGITSTASILFSNEATELNEVNADELYLTKILPQKMTYNLFDLKKSSLIAELRIMFYTVFKKRS